MFSLAYLFTVYAVVIRLEAYSQYYVSEKVTSWEEANTTCELATPPLQGLYHRRYARLAKIDGLPRGDYWVGYATVPKLFQYEGCTAWSSIDRRMITSYFELVDGPEMCYSACRTQVFGIERNKCYCFKQIPDMERVNKCECSIWFWISCYGDGALAMYSVIYHPPLTDNHNDSTKVCVAKSGNRYRWADCSDKLDAECIDAKDNGTPVEFYYLSVTEHGVQLRPENVSTRLRMAALCNDKDAPIINKTTSKPTSNETWLKQYSDVSNDKSDDVICQQLREQIKDNTICPGPRLIKHRVLIAGVVVAIAVIVGIVIVLFFKKRSRARSVFKQSNPTENSHELSTMQEDSNLGAVGGTYVNTQLQASESINIYESCVPVEDEHFYEGRPKKKK